MERTGFDKGLFSEWRDDPNFVMNQDEYLGAKVLVAGANFGTGSSREHAVWAIQQYGFEAVVSPRFGPIFKNNSTKNGLVAVEVTEEVGKQLMAAVQTDPTMEIVVDVERRTLEAPSIDLEVSFDLSDAVQHRFLNGLDDIGLTMQNVDSIDAFEGERPAFKPSTKA